MRISEYTVVQKSIRFLSLLELPHYTSTNANTNLVSIHKDLVYVFVCYLFYYYVFHSHCVLSNIDNWICFPETTKLTNIMSISFLLPLTVSFQIISFSHQSVVLRVKNCWKSENRIECLFTIPSFISQFLIHLFYSLTWCSTWSEIVSLGWL